MELKVPSFQKYPHLYYRFSYKVDGHTNLFGFLSSNAISHDSVVAMHQTHSTAIQLVTQADGGKTLDTTDGLITTQKNLFLLVKTADCLPVLFFEPHKEIIGIAHLGWKGIINGLGSKMIEQIVQLGGQKDAILIAIGPCIRECSYEIPDSDERLALFSKRFGSKVIIHRNHQLFLDLPGSLKTDLINSGLYSSQIADLEICTFCRSSDFYSYRYGKFIGKPHGGSNYSIIGLTK